MIRVVLGVKDGSIVSFSVSGHSGYAESGEDIVCSAVSALSINTVNSLEAIAQETFEFEEDEDGYLSVEFDHKPSRDAEVLLRAFELGIEGVIDSYGNEFVSLVIETKEI